MSHNGVCMACPKLARFFSCFVVFCVVMFSGISYGAGCSNPYLKKFFKKPTTGTWVAANHYEMQDKCYTIVRVTRELLHMYNQKYFPNCQGLPKGTTCSRYIAEMDKVIKRSTITLADQVERQEDLKKIFIALVNIDTKYNDPHPYYVIQISKQIFGKKFNLTKQIKNPDRAKQIKKWLS